MKDKQKRQILLGVCCLLFLIGVIVGALVSLRHGADISVFSINAEKSSTFSSFISVFKFPLMILIIGLVPEARPVMYFIILYKGFSLGYITFSMAEASLIKRLIKTSFFLPQELVLLSFLIMMTVYFSSTAPIKVNTRGYKQEIMRRRTEYVILIFAAILLSFLCSIWKNTIFLWVYNLL